VPVQPLLVKKVKFAVPVGVPAPEPDTVAWSVTVEPRGSGTDGETAEPPDSTVVVVWLLAINTVNGSQDPVDEV
jgi:hypothetical protein